MKKIFPCLLLATICLSSIPSSVAATELIPDGSFENYDDTWQCDLNCTLAGAVYYFVFGSAVDGISYAYLLHDAGVYQDVTIPAGARSLSLWYDNQPDDVVPEDGSFAVYLLNPTTNEVYTQQLFTEQSDTWINGGIDIPATLAGQTVRLYISNITGFNRIDLLEFNTIADDIANPEYATIKLRIMQADQTPVKGARIFIKQGGKKLPLINLKTNSVIKQLVSNKKGNVPRFVIMQALSSGDTLKLCVKKKAVKDCVEIAPEPGLQTNYEFSF